MSRLKKPFLFSLAMLPIAVIAGFFTCMYQIGLYSPEILEDAVAQIGSKEMLVLVCIIQVLIYTFLCSFFGYILSEKVSLWKPLRFEKSMIMSTLLVSFILGILFSLDYWTFGNLLPKIKEATASGMTLNGIVASILYGGIIEEIMLRMFLMSLIVFIMWKLFFRNTDREHIPTVVFIVANIIAALLFAAGHLPATINIFGELTPLILFRCFLLNAGFGLVFGRLYRKYGIWYAMLSHATVHIISKLILLIFV